MSTSKLWHSKATKKSKSTVKSRTLFSMFFVAAFLITPSSIFSQTSSAGHLESIVYRFTITDVIDATQATAVQNLLMTKEFATSCNFIDEADCFKLSSSERITYETLKEALLAEGFILSSEVFLSDGTVIRSIVQLNEEH